MTNRQYRRRRVTVQPTWEKPVASLAGAWVRRNCRHVDVPCHGLMLPGKKPG